MSETSGQAPAPTPTPAPSPAPAAQAPAAAPTQAGDWTTGLNDDMRNFVQNKGFKDVTAVLDSYRGLEKAIGAKAEHLIKLPENMDTPEGRAVWERLGAPKDAKEYKIEIPKEHGDPKLADGLREIAHKTGMTHKQVEGLVNWWNERTGGAIKMSQEAHQTRLTDAHNNLKKEWGAAYEQNKNLADQGAIKMGMGEKEVKALGAALGPDKALMLLHKLGTATGEASFVSGQSAGGSVLAPQAAMAEINSLKNDPNFAKRIASGDKEALRQLTRLHEQAAGQMPAH